MPSAEVNSVMIRPHPPRSRINRRKTVSVTPAMGASTVAGAMRTPPIITDEGTGTACPAKVACVVAGDSPALGPEASQYLRTALFYPPLKTKPPPKRGLKFVRIRAPFLLLRRFRFRILPAEALYPAGRIQELLF